MQRIQGYDSAWGEGILSVFKASQDASVEMAPALAQRLCETLHLAPAQLSSYLGEPIRVDRLQELLMSGAEESAALQLLGPDTAYMISRSPTGNTMVTIVAPGSMEHSHTAPSLLLGIIGVICELAVWHMEANRNGGNVIDITRLN